MLKAILFVLAVESGVLSTVRRRVALVMSLFLVFLGSLGLNCCLCHSPTSSHSLFHLHNVCWSSSQPNTITVHHSSNNHSSSFPLPSHLNYTTFEFLSSHSSPQSWNERIKNANIFIPKPISFVFTYQCAFQHVTRELLPHLSYLYGSSQEMIKVPLDSILFFQKAPYSTTPHWTNSFLSLLTKSLPSSLTLGNLSYCPLIENTFHRNSSCQPFLSFYKPQHTCLPKTHWSFCANTIIFSNHAWYHDLQSSQAIRQAILGNAITQSPHFICLNQRIGTRSIENLQEVHDLLVKLFPNNMVKIFHYEGKSFLQQIHLINQCKLILHPHSGGETNLIFLQPNSTVIEFFPKNFPPISYYGELVKSTGSTHIPVILEDVTLPNGCEKYINDESSCVRPPFSYRVSITRCNFCYKDATLRVNLSDLRDILHKVSLG